MRAPAACTPRAGSATAPERIASHLVIAIALMWAFPARALQPLDGLLACRKIASSAARLACFDRQSAAIAANASNAPSAANTANTVSTLPTATASRKWSAASSSSARGSESSVSGTGPAAPSGHSAALDPLQTFGLPPAQILAREEAARRAPRPLQRIRAHIVALASAGDGREIFTLDNQQVWAEIEPTGDLYAKPGDPVEISRGWLGSYSLSLKSRRACKVTRLR